MLAIALRGRVFCFCFFLSDLGLGVLGVVGLGWEMASAAATARGPRYAPPDPTLPKPWRGLIDGNTGYLYFWNPETKAVQYDRPTAPPPSSPPAQQPPERPRNSDPAEVAHR